MPADEKPEPYWPPEPWRPAATDPAPKAQLEELLAHTRVVFPSPLAVENVAQIFERVTDLLGYNVAYTITSAKETYLVAGVHPTTTGLRTTITGKVIGRGFLTPFACESDRLDPTLISALTFQTPQSEKLEDIPATQRELMEQVRVVIKEYLGV